MDMTYTLRNHDSIRTAVINHELSNVQYCNNHEITMNTIWEIRVIWEIRIIWEIRVIWEIGVINFTEMQQIR